MARFNNGWIKVYRAVGDGDLSENPILLALWMKLLMWAHWKSSKIVWKGQQRELPPGSVVFGIREIARKWRTSPDTISRWLKYLTESGRIACESSARGSVVTILNWEQYQSDDDADRTLIGRVPDTGRTVAGRDPDLIEEVKKEERRKKINTPPIGGDFDAFWERYPRKISKSDARARFIELIRTEGDFAALLAALARFRAHHEERGTEAQYIPHPTTFLGTKKIPRWRDWLDSDAGTSAIAPRARDGQPILPPAEQDPFIAEMERIRRSAVAGNA